jgi:hypothetical protein
MIPGKLGRLPSVDVAIAGGQFLTDPTADDAVNGATVALQTNTAALFNQASPRAKTNSCPP